MVEGIIILRKLGTEERITFDGRFYKLHDAFVETRPVQNPLPIWLIGNPGIAMAQPRVIERNLRRVARLRAGSMTTA